MRIIFALRQADFLGFRFHISPIFFAVFAFRCRRRFSVFAAFTPRHFIFAAFRQRYAAAIAG